MAARPAGAQPARILGSYPASQVPSQLQPGRPQQVARAQPQSVQPVEPRRLVATVGGTSGPAPVPVEGRPSAPQQVRFADELPSSQLLPRTQPPQTPSLSDKAAFNVAQSQTGPARAGAAAKSALRRTSYGSQVPQAARAPPEEGCRALACTSQRQGPAKSSGDTALGPAQRPRGQRPLPDPELLVVRFLYLSKLPVGSWMQGPAQYLLSLHVGEDARNDPPPVPGMYTTKPVQAGPPMAVAPEEALLKQQIAKSVAAMEAGDGQDQAQAAADAVECRFKVRVSVRLSEAGPGPAAGGPVYFRVDAWSLPLGGGGLFGGSPKPTLFARAFVPINEPNYHRRACTWPMVDARGKDCSFLTCEFSFARVPSPVQELRASNITAADMRLSWLPPAGEDKVVPVQGYRVEARPLGRQPGSAGSWQVIGEVEAAGPAEKSLPARGLNPDTRYHFRVCAVNEVGTGQPEELEATTAPCAPSGCGAPRLAGCNGPVLAVEWDPPPYDGGADIVAYRVWVRPFTASNSKANDWLEVGHVKHSMAGVQRAEIHTEDFDSTIGRYLCRVAAVNAAGEVGPATPDAVCLTLPNPCSVSKPMPAVAALTDFDSSMNGDAWPRSANEGLLTINEPGKKKVAVPLFNDGLHFPDVSIGLVESPTGRGKSSPSRGGNRFSAHLAEMRDPSASFTGQLDFALPDNLDEATYANWRQAPSRVASSDARCWHQEEAFGPAEDAYARALVPVNRSRPVSTDNFGAFSRTGGVSPPPPGPRESQDPKLRRHLQEAWDQQQIIERMLQEKRDYLQSSLDRYRKLGSEPGADPVTFEEVEIEAAGLQAEVAVLSQKLNDLAQILGDGEPGAFAANSGGTTWPYGAS